MKPKSARINLPGTKPVDDRKIPVNLSWRTYKFIPGNILKKQKLKLNKEPVKIKHKQHCLQKYNLLKHKKSSFDTKSLLFLVFVKPNITIKI